MTSYLLTTHVAKRAWLGCGVVPSISGDSSCRLFPSSCCEFFLPSWLLFSHSPGMVIYACCYVATSSDDALMMFSFYFISLRGYIFWWRIDDVSLSFHVPLFAGMFLLFSFETMHGMFCPDFTQPLPWSSLQLPNKKYISGIYSVYDSD